MTKRKDLTKNTMLLRLHHWIFFVQRKLVHFFTLGTHFLNLEIPTNWLLISKNNLPLVIIILISVRCNQIIISPIKTVINIRDISSLIYLWIITDLPLKVIIITLCHLIMVSWVLREETMVILIIMPPPFRPPSHHLTNQPLLGPINYQPWAASSKINLKWTSKAIKRRQTFCTILPSKKIRGKWHHLWSSRGISVTILIDSLVLI